MATSLPNSAKTLAARRRDYEARQRSLTATLREQFTRYFESYQDELARYFNQYFVRPYPPQPADDEGKVVPPFWRVEIAAPLQTVPTLTSLYSDGLQAVALEAVEALDDDLVDAYRSGFEHALWALYLDGVDEAMIEESLDEDAVLALLLTSGVGGANYRDRLQGWIVQSVQQVGALLGVNVAAGSTLPDTLGAFERVVETVRQRIEALGANEAFLAMTLGAAAAYERFGVGEVWVTADDEKVCPICWPLHLTITTKQPIIDTHPGCRCEKLPTAQVSTRGSRSMGYPQFQAARVAA